MRSIEKSGYPDFGFAIEREIRKRISMLIYLFLDSDFYCSIGKSAKGFEKLNSGLVRARITSKNKTAVHENSFANPFSDFPIER